MFTHPYAHEYVLAAQQEVRTRRLERLAAVMPSQSIRPDPPPKHTVRRPERSPVASVEATIPDLPTWLSDALRLVGSLRLEDLDGHRRHTLETLVGVAVATARSAGNLQFPLPDGNEPSVVLLRMLSALARRTRGSEIIPAAATRAELDRLLVALMSGSQVPEARRGSRRGRAA